VPDGVCEAPSEPDWNQRKRPVTALRHWLKV